MSRLRRRRNTVRERNRIKKIALACLALLVLILLAVVLPGKVTAQGAVFGTVGFIFLVFYGPSIKRKKEDPEDDKKS